MHVQIEILKIIFQGSRKPTKNVCNENEKEGPHKFCLWWKEEFIRLHQKSGGTDFDELQDTVSTLNKGTNSLVTSESEPDGWFIARRRKTSAIKFTVAGSQDW